VFRKIFLRATLDPAAQARFAGGMLLIAVNEIRDFLKHENAIALCVTSLRMTATPAGSAELQGERRDDRT
jgi:hypothetical protein